MVDGSVAGSWRVQRAGEKATLAYTLFEHTTAAAERELRDEAAGRVRFHEPGAAAYSLARTPVG